MNRIISIIIIFSLILGFVETVYFEYPNIGRDINSNISVYSIKFLSNTRKLSHKFGVKKAIVKYINNTRTDEFDIVAGVGEVGGEYDALFSMAVDKYMHIWNIISDTADDFITVTIQSFKDTGEVIKRMTVSTVIEAEYLSVDAEVFSDTFYNNIKDTAGSIVSIASEDLKNTVYIFSRLPMQINPFIIK